MKMREARHAESAEGVVIGMRGEGGARYARFLTPHFFAL